MKDQITCHVCVVSSDEQWLQQWYQSLNAVATEHDNPLNIRFFGAISLETAKRDLSTNPDVQALILDSCGTDDPLTSVMQLRSIRPEISYFVATESSALLLDDHAFDELLDRHDHNFHHVFRILQSLLLKRASTPFADTLRNYIYGARDSWHTPGHSGGDSLRDSPWISDFYTLMGEHVFNADLSVSVQVLDSLQEPHSVIQHAQELAAQTFGSDHTFFVTNGTSTANKVIVQHLLGGGGKILLDRGSHKSMHHAVILFGIEPVYLQSSLQADYGLYGPVSKQTIFDAIDNHPDAGLLVLTSCTYDGLYYDLAPIIAHAHAANIKVLIDEAWYSHGRFHPVFRPNALDCGADYVTQSTHKTLSAFSQASMIHVCDPEFDEARFRENLNMHTSTSPQYAMIASLDVARKQMSMEGYKCLCLCLLRSDRLRQEIDSTRHFQVLSLQKMLPDQLRADSIRLDPTKLTIDISQSGFTGRQLQMMLFEEFNIQVEKTTHNTVSVLVTLGTTESKILRLIHALKKISSRIRHSPAPTHSGVTPLPAFSDIRCLPRTAYFGPAELVPLTCGNQGLNPALITRLCADEVVPYPPGIPVLVPGQQITEPIAQYLLQLVQGQMGTEVHGLIFSAEIPHLRVCRESQPPATDSARA